MNKVANDMLDNKTLLLDTGTQEPAMSKLTDHTPKPRAEFLHSREVYHAEKVLMQSFTISLNPLVSAASALFSQVVQIKHSHPPASVEALYQSLCENIKRFEQQALVGGIEHGDVRIARYLLCTVADEAVMTAPWERKGPWDNSSLLSAFHAETKGGETFFALLQRFEQAPARHLPMLELIYLCLALGFEGKYQVEHRGTHDLEQIRDSLYRQIREIRGEVSRELSPHWQGLTDQRRRLVSIVPWWLVALFTLISLATMYTGFAWVLSEQLDSVLQPFMQLDAPVIEPQPPTGIF
ncbi:type IVB secretion system protein IcmH/DotU [Pseudomonas sp. D47]|uniref:type IVB secretion system protein IcmH/DotU n=1 Tax=Pseudomonas sp. D47 TaxID=3159447 RepID=UPI00387B085B